MLVGAQILWLKFMSHYHTLHYLSGWWYRGSEWYGTALRPVYVYCDCDSISLMETSLAFVISSFAGLGRQRRIGRRPIRFAPSSTLMPSPAVDEVVWKYSRVFQSVLLSETA